MNNSIADCANDFSAPRTGLIDSAAESGEQFHGTQSVRRRKRTRRHPSPHKIESFILGHLTLPDALRVQQHLRICANCMAILSAIESKNALPPTNETTEGPLSAVHELGDSYMCLQTDYHEGQWIARWWNRECDQWLLCSGKQEANQFLNQIFMILFPAHQCTHRCQARDAQIVGSHLPERPHAPRLH